MVRRIMKTACMILQLAILIPAVASLDVATLFDSSLVDTDHEALNIVQSVSSASNLSPVTYPSLSAWVSALADSRVALLPDLDSFSYYSMSTSQATAIKSFVENGGTLVSATDSWQKNHKFLNQAMGWSIKRKSNYYSSYNPPRRPEVAGTCFAADEGSPDALPHMSSTTTFSDSRYLPSGSTVLYGDGSRQVSVFSVPVGSGSVYMLAYDWKSGANTDWDWVLTTALTCGIEDPTTSSTSAAATTSSTSSQPTTSSSTTTSQQPTTSSTSQQPTSSSTTTSASIPTTSPVPTTSSAADATTEVTTTESILTTISADATTSMANTSLLSPIETSAPFHTTSPTPSTVATLRDSTVVRSVVKAQDMADSVDADDELSAATYDTFTGWLSALPNARAAILPELKSSSITSEQAAQILHFVENGGTLASSAASWGHNHDFLNTVFGWSTKQRYWTAADTPRQAAAEGGCFRAEAGSPNELPSASSVIYSDQRYLPEGSTILYSDGGQYHQVSLWSVEVGAGAVYVFAYDWASGAQAEWDWALAAALKCAGAAPSTSAALPTTATAAPTNATQPVETEASFTTPMPLRRRMLATAIASPLAKSPPRESPAAALPFAAPFDAAPAELPSLSVRSSLSGAGRCAALLVVMLGVGVWARRRGPALRITGRAARIQGFEEAHDDVEAGIDRSETAQTCPSSWAPSPTPGGFCTA